MATNYLTPGEIAEQLKVHEKTVHNWLKAGKLKGIKLERFWRVEESAFREFLEEHKR